MPVTAIIFFGFKGKNLDDISLSKFLIFDVLITKTFLFRYLQFLEHIMTAAPFFTASSINFSPLILFPLIAKKMKPFLTFLLFIYKPRISIFFFNDGSFLISFFSNIFLIKIFTIYG